MNQDRTTRKSKFNRRAGDRPKGRVRVAAVGDLHVHESPSGTYRNFFETVSRAADVLLLCGDLTHLGLPAEAENLAKDLSAASIPVLGILGNHDHHSGFVPEIKKILGDAGMHLLEEETFQFENVGFAGVKGFCGGFGKYMLGAFGEKALKDFVAEAINEELVLENALRNLDCEHIIVATHYAPVIETIKGEPLEIYPFLGSSRLEETINYFEKIRAVFHGHSHHGSHEGKTAKGVPVFNCALEVLSKQDREYILFEI